jgi:hypothetical protein
MPQSRAQTYTGIVPSVASGFNSPRSGCDPDRAHDGFRALRGRGATRIVLDVDAENTTSALRLYASAGMTPRPAFTTWEKRPVPAALH